MNRYLPAILALLLTLGPAIAQTAGQSIRIDWKLSEQPPAKLRPLDISLFDPQHYEFDGQMIYYRFSVEGIHIEPGSVEIRPQFSPLPDVWVRFLGLGTGPSGVRVRVSNAGAGGKPVSIVAFNTLVYRKGKWMKLDKLELTYRRKPSSLHRRTVAPVGHSILSQGKTYRFRVEKTGVYRIDKSFLESLGVNVSQIDPRNIHILGWGGRMLPLENDDQPQELAETPIEVHGEADGRFDSGDYILFFAYGEHSWNNESQTFNNLYTGKAYYYLHIDNTPGLRITDYSPPSGSLGLTLNEYYTERFYETDSINMVSLGRRWFGNNFNQGQAIRTFEFDFPPRVPGRKLRYALSLATDNPAPGSLSISINGTPAPPININALTDIMRNNGLLAIGALRRDSLDVSGDHISVRLQYNDNGYASARIHLDYLKVGAFCRLQARSDGFLVQHPAQESTSDNVRYHLGNASNVPAVWDVSNPFDIKRITNNGQADFYWTAPPGKRRYFVLGTRFLTPEKAGKTNVEQSDLHYDVFYFTGSLHSPDYLLIAPAAFEASARRLVEFHSQRGLRAYFAPLEKIYLEFGNGTPDPAAIRNFIRYVYLNAPSPAERLRYVLLMGDTSWDFKNLMHDAGENSNVIPSYQSLQSFSLVSSFVTDDFFAGMDDGEGWLDMHSAIPDLAVGRLTVSSADEAEKMTDKLLHYYDTSTYGIWHNTVTLLSDDADGPDRVWELGLIYSTMAIAHDIETHHPHIRLNKIYLDAYRQQSTSGGYRYPEAKRDLLNAFEQGTLILNFIGHGNEYGWTHERVMNVPEIESLRNYDKLPFVSTVTCEFGRFDNPDLVSGAELFTNNFQGGAFQVITTVREINAHAGMNFNKSLYKYLLGTETGHFVRFRTPGEALMLTKQHWGSINNKISLLGDPAMPLHFGRPQVVITSVQGALTDTIRALDRVQVHGKIYDANNQFLSGYNGKLSVRISDKSIEAQTLNNDNVPGQNISFRKIGPTIFSGQTSITNGEFSFEFVAPKDLRPNYGHGRIGLYGRQNTDIRHGVDTTRIVGGINTQAPDDNTPPLIRLYMNDENFADGGITDANPFLLAKLSDENGINTVGGVGHDLVAVIDGREDLTFILNDYYQADENTYRSGKIKFKLFDLEPGEHTLRFTAWDTYNNKGTAELHFRVVQKEDLQISRVLNYPNPFTDYTEFWFTHNRPFETLDVWVRVFNVAGKLVWSHHQSIVDQGFTSRDIHWDGRDDFGQRLAKGVYFYQIILRTADGKQVSRWEKLVKL